MEADLGRIIGQVYEAATHAAAWETCLTSISGLLGGTAAGLLHHDHRTHGGGIHASAWSDPEATRLYIEHYHAKDPWALALSGRPLSPGQILPGQRVVPHDRVVKSEFHAVFRRYGITRVIMAFLEASPERTAVLSVNRSDRDEEFGERATALLAVLLPHVRRALQIHRRLVTAEEHRAALTDVIDRLDTGVVLVDAALKPVLINRAARELLGQCDGLVIAAGELRARTPEPTRRLRDALASAAAVTAGLSMERPGAALCIGRPSGRRAYQLLVTPLDRANDWAEIPGRAVAIVFITDPERVAQSPDGILRQLYGFTPAEARIAAALAAGKTVNEIAAIRGLTRETVRWYVKSVLSKASVSTQAQLVRLVLSAGGPARVR